MTAAADDDRRQGQRRPAKDVIDQAIRENRVAETLLYVFAAILVFLGGAVLIYGVASQQAVATIAGVISTSFFVPAMTLAKRIRKENIAIRLLEVPLNRADTAKDAASAIRDSFVKLNSGEPEIQQAQPSRRRS